MGLSRFLRVRNVPNYPLFCDSLYKESERCSYCKVESRISSSFMRLFVFCSEMGIL